MNNNKVYARKRRKKEKAFNKRYNRECGECITRKASKEEIDALINNLLDKHTTLTNTHGQARGVAGNRNP